jgi:hypothetical protein
MEEKSTYYDEHTKCVYIKVRPKSRREQILLSLQNHEKDKTYLITKDITRDMMSRIRIISDTWSKLISKMPHITDTELKILDKYTEIKCIYPKFNDIIFNIPITKSILKLANEHFTLFEQSTQTHCILSRKLFNESYLNLWTELPHEYDNLSTNEKKSYSIVSLLYISDLMRAGLYGDAIMFLSNTYISDSICPIRDYYIDKLKYASNYLTKTTNNNYIESIINQQHKSLNGGTILHLICQVCTFETVSTLFNYFVEKGAILIKDDFGNYPYNIRNNYWSILNTNVFIQDLFETNRIMSDIYDEYISKYLKMDSIYLKLDTKKTIETNNLFKMRI